MSNGKSSNWMLEGAKSHAYAYRILLEKSENAKQKMELGEPFNINDIKLAFPMIMNLSFSCEIYLKFLIIKCGKKYDREHDLQSLHKILIQDYQDKIRDHYINMNGNDDFEKKLEDSKNVFKDWRYFYEIDLDKQPYGIYVVDTPFLDCFLKCLEKICNEV